MKEAWKDIKGYEGKYKVSNLGRIKSLYKNKDGKVMKYLSNPNGYLYIALTKGDRNYKRLLIHRLVAIHFIPNPEDKPQVNHIDGNKHNNSVSNLEWVTGSENQIHAYNHKLRGNKDIDDDLIIDLYINKKMPTTKIAKIYGVDYKTIVRRLKKNNIQLRNASDRKKIFNLEEFNIEEKIKHKTIKKIACEIGCSRQTIDRYIKQEKTKECETNESI